MVPGPYAGSKPTNRRDYQVTVAPSENPVGFS